MVYRVVLGIQPRLRDSGKRQQGRTVGQTTRNIFASVNYGLDKQLVRRKLMSNKIVIRCLDFVGNIWKLLREKPSVYGCDRLWKIRAGQRRVGQTKQEHHPLI